MKKIMILGCAMLASFNVLADSQYPASDFQPQVIYQDKSVTSAPAPAASSNEQDPNYPAANFQPTVIYSDASATSAKTPAVSSANEFEPNYPAANFQPKVIYP